MLEFNGLPLSLRVRPGLGDPSPLSADERRGAVRVDTPEKQTSTVALARQVLGRWAGMSIEPIHTGSSSRPFGCHPRSIDR